jgi:hypothetical protein
MKFEVLTALKISNVVFLLVMACSLIGCCRHLNLEDCADIFL